MNYPGLEDIIKRALTEDIGHMDITTATLIPPAKMAEGIFQAKSQGVLAGIDISSKVFTCLDPGVEFKKIKRDGDIIQNRDTLAVVKGRAQTLLTAERVALNFLQHLSGIATKTSKMLELIAGLNVTLVDTRKTTPGLRVLEKYAVQTGGGRNHRFGLYDGVMIKDNHIQIAGSIKEAVAIIKKRVPHTIKIEVEIETLEQLQEALDAGADIILLDNMDTVTMKQAVQLAGGKALLEASGGIDEHNIVAVAGTGVNFISMGALTHSADSLDISFDIIT